MRFLLIPENNSLSHAAKCLAVGDCLSGRGHEILLVASANSSPFLARTGVRHCVLPDIQEADGAGLPTVEWFRKPDRIIETIRKEVDLFREFKPDRILSVFRFTARASAAILGIPCDSLACGCMLPEAAEPLGFIDDGTDSTFQQVLLNGFYHYGAAKMNVALRAFGLDPIADIRSMLEGDRTYLWDFPEFFPYPRTSHTVHVGPVSWDGWPYDEVNEIDDDALAGTARPVAIVSFGTCVGDAFVTGRITTILARMGYFVVVAAGGQKTLVNCLPSTPNIQIREFAPLAKILPRASLVVTHGGQLTIFEALRHEVPVAVMPFQPEQAHNGVCLERIGCGVRLIPSASFQGNPRVYLERLEEMTDTRLEQRINALVENPGTYTSLAAVKTVLDSYRGAEAVADYMETN